MGDQMEVVAQMVQRGQEGRAANYMAARRDHEANRQAEAYC
jgi:hypothetical protein